MRIWLALFSVLAAVTSAEVTEIALGASHTCALLTGGTIKCWGFNDKGQLGNGTTAGYRTTPVDVSGITTATSVALGDHHTCALLTGGAIKCWGHGGRLGDGTTTESATPVDVSGITTATSLALGSGHSCALLTGGAIKCWGDNGAGSCGDGTYNNNRNTPVDVSGITTATSLALGGGSSCALLTGGTIKCWGSNWAGQLGDGTTESRTTPVDVSGITTATGLALRLGAEHSCALLTGGAIECWGRNKYGQLGDGTTTESATPPVDVSGITTAMGLALGEYHSCALLTGSTIKCWGRNFEGQLGDGTIIQPTTPVNVYGISTALSIALGGSHSCALLTGGAIKCWGNNNYGQLGDGTTTQRTTPVDVSGSPCDASAAPTNGAAGDCTNSLASGSTCQPTCDSGYTVSGTSSCTLGTLTVATCTSNENKYICLDPTKFTASKQVTFSGYTTSCDTWIDAAQGSGQVFYGITFDSTFDASAQTTTVQNGLKMYAGPYGGNGLNCCSDGKSAAFKNHTYFCQDANDWLPDKSYSGTETSGATMTCTQFVEFNSELNTQDFTASWSCDGKSAAIQSHVQDLGAAIMGCCGSTKKSACSNTRAHVCENPSTFLPSHTFKSDDGMFDGTCYTAVGTTNTDATSDCYGEDFSKTWSCAAKTPSCQLRLLEIARKGCCGTSGEPASACHGHYSGAASSQHVGVLALATALAVVMA